MAQTSCNGVLVVNVQRIDVPALDLAAKLTALPNEQKWSQKALAQKIGRSEAQLCRLLQLDRLSDRVEELVRTNQRAATTAATLAGLPEDEQNALAEQLVSGALTRDGIAKAVRKKSPGRCGRKPASPTRVFRFSTGRGEEFAVKSAAELTPASPIERLKQVIHAAEKAEKQGLGTRVIGDFLKAMAKTSKPGPTT